MAGPKLVLRYPPAVEGPSFDDELATARRILDEEDDAPHALKHLVGALAIRPNDPDALALLDELREAMDVIDALDGDGFLGAHAARARVLSETGELAAAVELCADLADFAPHLGFEHWLAEWSPRLEGLSVNIRSTLPALARALGVGIGRLRLTATEQEAVLPYATFAEALTTTATGREEAFLHSLASGILRRVGHVDRAIALSERALELGDDQQGEISLGLALRLAGRYDEADAAFARAHETLGDDTFLAERARALADAERYEEAKAMLERRAERDVEPDAELRATRKWLDACIAKDETALARNLDDIRRSATHGYIPPMTDASVQILHDPKVFGVEFGSMAVTTLECPSARLCIALASGEGDPRALDYAFGDVAGARSPIPLEAARHRRALGRRRG